MQVKNVLMTFPIFFKISPISFLFVMNVWEEGIELSQIILYFVLLLSISCFTYSILASLFKYKSFDCSVLSLFLNLKSFVNILFIYDSFILISSFTDRSEGLFWDTNDGITLFEEKAFLEDCFPFKLFPLSKKSL